MVWRRPGAKPLSEPMMVNLLTHLYASIGLNELWAGNSDHQNHHHQSPGCVKNVQRAMTPPWSVGLDQYCKQEWRWTPFLGILSRNGKMTLKVKVNDPHFQYQTWEQAKFPRIRSQNGQSDPEGQGQRPPFFYQPKICQDASLVQILWSQSKTIATQNIFIRYKRNCDFS